MSDRVCRIYKKDLEDEDFLDNAILNHVFRNNEEGLRKLAEK